MECSQNQWTNESQFFTQLNQKVIQQHIPIYGSIDLTHRCNLKCVHCYVGPLSNDQNLKKEELNTDHWIDIIDEFTEAGCLYLLITGGEPLLRDDFSEIYRHAKKRGLLITIFTNGTLISDQIIELFSDLPPWAVDISLYGATAATYEKVTGVSGSHKKCLNGIRKLLDNRIYLSLKTVLMTHNIHEFFQIEKMVKELGVHFRFDCDIFPRFNGDKRPLDLRVSPEEVIKNEFAIKDRFDKWKDYYEKRKDLSVPDTLYNCGAGLTYFHIDPYGNLQPCLMVRNIKFNLLTGSFSNGWHHVIPQIREKKSDPGLTCNTCQMRTVCDNCPAFSMLENGAEDTYSEYLCNICHLRYQMIKKETLKGNLNGRCEEKQKVQAHI